MNVITATEFRNNQRKYFDLAERETVFVTRVGKRPIALMPVDLEEALTEEDLKSIQRGVNDIKEGRSKQVSAVTLWDDIE